LIRAAAGVAALLVLAGCGSTETRTITETVTRVQQCNGITADLSFRYAICANRFMRDGEALAIGKPSGAKVGHWAKAYLSPDGKTFLAQWSAECEIPTSFFVPVRGGVPRAVTGEADWAKAPQSIADGWTEDGRAIVEISRGDCGLASHRGIYLIAQDGTRSAIG
jgi:hypothetical protein